MRSAAAALILTLAFAPAAMARQSREADTFGRGPWAYVANVGYNGGPVLHSNFTHVIFWRPQGSGLVFDPGYRALVDRFLRDVALASHSTKNVFGLSGQYTDYRHRPAAYDSHWDGPVLDTDHLPPNQCAEPYTGPRWAVCLTDSELQAEIDHVVHSRHLPTRQGDVYFLVTPRGFGSCMDSSDSCALGGSVNGYCGYHSKTTRGLHYAVIPYNAVSGHCQSDNPRPNASTADPALSTISHELSEVITDPDQNAWVDESSGQEIGDLCITTFGPAIGGLGSRRYNELIHGGHYYLQEEWSNANGGCEPRARPDHVSLFVLQKRRKAWEFRGKARDPEGRIVGYHWDFGDGTTGAGRTVSHDFPHSGPYTVKLRVTDSWDNWAFYARTVVVP
jgi:hypothetical protein